MGYLIFSHQRPQFITQTCIEIAELLASLVDASDFHCSRNSVYFVSGDTHFIIGKCADGQWIIGPLAEAGIKAPELTDVIWQALQRGWLIARINPEA